ncbi:MAG: hypothetical protein JST04_16640 [Bdellovibrionales bacterium]|nr:hypothetical protein [Bdellovibrionales bacterium]
MRRALALALAYLSWNTAFRLVVLSVVTYFMARSGSTFGEISETTNTNLILVCGFAALSFLFVLTQLNPIATVSRSEIVTGHLIEHRFYPNFLRGAVFACVFAFAGLVGGYYHYVGFFVQSDAPALALFGLLFRATSIVLMVYVDEFIFRGRFMAHIRDGAHPARSIVLCALFYTLSKSLEFHLGWAHLITLALLGTALSIRTYLHRNFAEGAGLLAGFLMVAHVAFSLPIFGNESQGFILLRYDIRFDVDAPMIRFLTGGLGGPLSSIVVQAAILFDILRNLYREKKSLWPLRSAELR